VSLIQFIVGGNAQNTPWHEPSSLETILNNIPDSNTGAVFTWVMSLTHNSWAKYADQKQCWCCFLSMRRTGRTLGSEDLRRERRKASRSVGESMAAMIGSTQLPGSEFAKRKELQNQEEVRFGQTLTGAILEKIWKSSNHPGSGGSCLFFKELGLGRFGLRPLFVMRDTDNFFSPHLESARPSIKS
jgi:hypothetical protein